MKAIIEAIDRNKIKEELNDYRFLRKTNKGGNEIYVITSHDSPNVMREIGRLRELSFRSAGGGTGDEIDIDHYDTDKNCYSQLIVWSPEDEEIVGGYRFKLGKEAIEEKEIKLSTTHYFNFSKEFIDSYLPYTIELGRSWVQPNYQPSVNPRKGLFALDNLWDGLGALVVKYPFIHYFFGKVTMYPTYNQEARDTLLYFMHTYFPDKEKLVTPIHPLIIHPDKEKLDQLFNDLQFKDAYKEVKKIINNKGEFIQPLINNYMHLSPTMKSFGTALNDDFGGVEETGILITISDIYEDKKERHLSF